MLKRFISLMMALISLLFIVSCGENSGGQSSNNPNSSPEEIIDIVSVAEFGAEINEPFILPEKISSIEQLAIKNSEGEEIEFSVDIYNRVVFTEIGDYTLIYKIGEGTKEYKVYVRDTRAPIFGQVTFSMVGFVGSEIDLSMLNVALDNSGEQKIFYKIYYLGVEESKVDNTNLVFTPQKGGYYIAVCYAMDSSGNYFTRETKINTIVPEDEYEINYFNSDLVSPVIGTLNSSIKMGDKGYSLCINVTGADNYGECAIGKDLSNEDTIYYSVYIDKNSFNEAAPEQIPASILPKPDYRTATGTGWTVTPLSELKYNEWIPVAARSGGQNNTTKTIRFYASNYQGTWKNDYVWTDSGLDYKIYVDDVRVSAHTSSDKVFEINPYTIGDVENKDGFTITLGNQGHGDSKYSVVLNCHKPNNAYIFVKFNCLGITDYSNVKSLYFYVYNNSDTDLSNSHTLYFSGNGGSRGQFGVAYKAKEWTKVVITKEQLQRNVSVSGGSINNIDNLWFALSLNKGNATLESDCLNHSSGNIVMPELWISDFGVEY